MVLVHYYENTVKEIDLVNASTENDDSNEAVIITFIRKKVVKKNPKKEKNVKKTQKRKQENQIDKNLDLRLENIEDEVNLKDFANTFSVGDEVGKVVRHKNKNTGDEVIKDRSEASKRIGIVSVSFEEIQVVHLLDFNSIN